MTGFKVGIVQISNGFLFQGPEGPESWVWHETKADAVTQLRVVLDSYAKAKEE